MRGVDEDAGPLPDAVVIVDGHMVEGDLDDDGEIRLRGLQAGWHDLVVAETSHLSQVFRLRWDDDDEQRTLDVRLTPRKGE